MTIFRESENAPPKVDPRSEPRRPSPPPKRDSDQGDRRPWWRQRRTVIAVAALVIILLSTFLWRRCHGAAATEETNIVVSVQVAKATRAPIANEVTTVATLVPRREASISPKVAAQISQMPLLTNRSVRAGDVLAVLESRDISAQRAEAAAAVVETEATAHSTVHGAVPLTNAQDQKSVTDTRAALDNATKTYERRQVLFEQGGISKKDLEASKLALTNAENDLRLAEASSSVHRGVTNSSDIKVAQAKAQQARDRLANLTAQLGYMVIRAPFAGVVTGQFQYQGDFANPGTKMLTIADTSNLIAKMQVGQDTASRLKAGDPVQVFPDDLQGRAINGSVELVGRGVDPQSRSVEVWVLVPNTAGALRPNGIARVVIAAQGVANAIVVPTSAVTLDATNGNSGTVMVVDANSVAHEVHVRVGAHSEGNTQITSGLKGGETVVTEGNYALPDGTKVSVARPGVAAEPPAE